MFPSLISKQSPFQLSLESLAAVLMERVVHQVADGGKKVLIHVDKLERCHSVPPNCYNGLTVSEAFFIYGFYFLYFDI